MKKVFLADIPYIKTGHESGTDWNYVLIRDVTFSLKSSKVSDKVFDNQYLRICFEDGNAYITVKKDYAWDGPTLVPDFNGTVLPSVYHDAIYQFSEDISSFFGWSEIGTLHFADLVFLSAMSDSGTNSVLKYTYFFGVVVVGFPFHEIAKLFR